MYMYIHIYMYIHTYIHYLYLYSFIQLLVDGPPSANRSVLRLEVDIAAIIEHGTQDLRLFSR